MDAGSDLYLVAGRVYGSTTVNGNAYVTKAGYLGNAPNDVNALTGVTPASDDVILLEDQSDSWNKKKSTVANLEGMLTHNNLASKQGGTSGEYYHLTEDENTFQSGGGPTGLQFCYQFDTDTDTASDPGG